MFLLHVNHAFKSNVYSAHQSHVNLVFLLGVNDHEIETVVARSAEAGAEFAGYVMLRLAFEVKDLFEEWLAELRTDLFRRGQGTLF